jgi:hypothetical protein
MKPFNIPNALESFIDTYPDAETILRAIKIGDLNTRCALARLWLSEGIPYCFKSQPAIYEAVRLWLSHNLPVHAKEITLIGSGRQGFSLSPDEHFGRPFGDYSDLDFSAVSLSLFTQLERAFSRWLSDYLTGTVLPRNDREKKYWEDNARRVPSNLARGFIDPYKIPAFDKYPEAQTTLDVMYKAHIKLRVTAGAPRVSRVSIRIYRDWDSFVRQLSINLEALLRMNPGK